MVGCRRIPNMREKEGASENLWMRREFVFAVVGCKKLPAETAPGVARSGALVAWAAQACRAIAKLTGPGNVFYRSEATNSRTTRDRLAGMRAGSRGVA
jgi:hypothetical protein